MLCVDYITGNNRRLARFLVNGGIWNLLGVLASFQSGNQLPEDLEIDLDLVRE